MGSSMGLIIGMLIGLVIGAVKDEIVNKAGEESVINVPKGQMEAEDFQIGDVVYLDDDGMIEQAFDKKDE